MWAHLRHQKCLCSFSRCCQHHSRSKMSPFAMAAARATLGDHFRALENIRRVYWLSSVSQAFAIVIQISVVHDMISGRIRVRRSAERARNRLACGQKAKIRWFSSQLFYIASILKKLLELELSTTILREN